MRTNYTEMELDALRELANIGAGTAATSLSGLLGMPIDVAVPTAAALPLADAIDATGPPELCVTGVAIPLDGDLAGAALMLFPEEDVSTLCGLLGLEPESEYAASALGEVVNILCASYLGALGDMTGLTIALGPPEQVIDMLGAIMGSILAMSAGASDVALMLDSALLAELEALGARRPVAVIVGGAQMFGAGGAGRMQVGARNEEAVRAALRASNLSLVAADTGGGSGRTIRVYLDAARVTSRIAGGTEADLHGRLAVAA